LSGLNIEAGYPEELCGFTQCLQVNARIISPFNPLPLLFKSLLPGQEDSIFFSGHLNLHAKPETGIPYRLKNYNN
jgi:hypothetical protein